MGRYKLPEFIGLLEDVLTGSNKTEEDPFSNELFIPEDAWKKAQGMLSDDCLIKDQSIFYWTRLNGLERSKRKKLPTK